MSYMTFPSDKITLFSAAVKHVLNSCQTSVSWGLHIFISNQALEHLTMINERRREYEMISSYELCDKQEWG